MDFELFGAVVKRVGPGFGLSQKVILGVPKGAITARGFDLQAHVQ
jgi:hypothetical protein